MNLNKGFKKTLHPNCCKKKQALFNCDDFFSRKRKEEFLQTQLVLPLSLFLFFPSPRWRQRRRKSNNSYFSWKFFFLFFPPSTEQTDGLEERKREKRPGEELKIRYLQRQLVIRKRRCFFSPNCLPGPMPAASIFL